MIDKWITYEDVQRLSISLSDIAHRLLHLVLKHKEPELLRGGGKQCMIGSPKDVVSSMGDL